MQISKTLELRKEDFKDLGEILVLYSPLDGDGNAAYYVEEEGEGKKIKEVGMGLRLSKETAVKLAWNILRSLGEI